MPPSMLTHTEYRKDSLIPVAIASLVPECSICTRPYSEEARPVLLPECGHIFCRTCITEWLGTGANTCPMDRKVLFRSPHTEEEEDMTDIYGAEALAPTPVSVARRTRTRRPVEEILVGGSIIARNSVLTFHGCRLVIHDLWHYTARLLHSLEEFSGPVTEPSDMDIELLRSCIQQAIPRGLRCSEACWAVLYECARRMLVWHSEGRVYSLDGEWSGGDSSLEEEFEDMVGALYEASGGAVER